MHIYIHASIHIYTYMYTYIHTCLHIHTYIQIHTAIYAYIHTSIHIYTHTHIYIYLYIHTPIHICIYVHAYTYIHVYIHTHSRRCLVFIGKAQDRADWARAGTGGHALSTRLGAGGAAGTRLGGRGAGTGHGRTLRRLGRAVLPGGKCRERQASASSPGPSDGSKPAERAGPRVAGAYLLVEAVRRQVEVVQGHEVALQQAHEQHQVHAVCELQDAPLTQGTALGAALLRVHAQGGAGPGRRRRLQH